VESFVFGSAGGPSSSDASEVTTVVWIKALKSVGVYSGRPRRAARMIFGSISDYATSITRWHRGRLHCVSDRGRQGDPLAGSPNSNRGVTTAGSCRPRRSVIPDGAAAEMNQERPSRLVRSAPLEGRAERLECVLSFAWQCPWSAPTLRIERRNVPSRGLTSARSGESRTIKATQLGLPRPVIRTTRQRPRETSACAQKCLAQDGPWRRRKRRTRSSLFWAL